MYYFDSRWKTIYTEFCKVFRSEMQAEQGLLDAWCERRLGAHELEAVLTRVVHTLYSKSSSDNGAAFHAQDVALWLRLHSVEVSEEFAKRKAISTKQVSKEQVASSRATQDPRSAWLNNELKQFSSDWLRERLCLERYNEQCELQLDPNAHNKMYILLFLHRLHGELSRAFDNKRYDILAQVSGADERMLAHEGGLYNSIKVALKQTHAASPERERRLLTQMLMAYDKTGEVTDKPSLPSKKYNNLVSVDTCLSSYMPYLLTILAKERQQKAESYRPGGKEDGINPQDRNDFQSWTESQYSEEQFIDDLIRVVSAEPQSETVADEKNLIELLSEEFSDDLGLLLAVCLLAGAEQMIYQDIDLLIKIADGNRKLSWSRAAKLSGDSEYKIRKRAQQLIDNLPDRLQHAFMAMTP